MAFAVDDIVLISSTDKMHPAMSDGSFRYGRILATEVNGHPRLYLVDIAGLASNYQMDEADLQAATGTIHPAIFRALAPPQTKGKR